MLEDSSVLFPILFSLRFLPFCLPSSISLALSLFPSLLPSFLPPLFPPSLLTYLPLCHSSKTIFNTYYVPCTLLGAGHAAEIHLLFHILSSFVKHHHQQNLLIFSMEGILLDSQRLMTSVWMLMIDLESVSKSWRCILQLALHRFY